MIVERFFLLLLSLSIILCSQLIHARSITEVDAVDYAINSDGDQSTTANYLYQSALDQAIILSAPRMNGLTFLAPNDQAWAGAPPYLSDINDSSNSALLLSNLYRLHIVKGYYTYTDLQALSPGSALPGFVVPIYIQLRQNDSVFLYTDPKTPLIGANIIGPHLFQDGNISMFVINSLLLPPNVTQLFYDISTIPELSDGPAAAPFPPPSPQNPISPTPPSPQLSPIALPSLPPQQSPAAKAPPPPSNHGSETPVVHPITLGANLGPPTIFELSPQPSILIQGRGRIGPSTSAAPVTTMAAWVACLFTLLLFQALL